MRVSRFLLFAAVLSVQISACDSGDTHVSTPEAISIDGGQSKAVSRGADLQIGAVATSDGGGVIADPAFTFVSDDPLVAIVNADGLVTGISKGSATISVSLGEVTQIVSLRVVDVQGVWKATVNDPASPGGVNRLTFTLMQDGIDVTGTYGNISGFPPITPDSIANITATLNVSSSGAAITLIPSFLLPASPCQLQWTSSLVLGENASGEATLTPREDLVDLSSPNCSEVRAQIRVAALSYYGPLE